MKKKILVTLAVVACALLLVAGSIVGTLAYLTSTKSVTNTFTVGNVTITLDEAKVDENGKAIDAVNNRVTGENANSYHILPGGAYDKDPTITLAANSEACYLFVKVQNGLASVEDNANNIVAQLAANNWVATGVDNVYVYTVSGNSVVAKSGTAQKFPVFATVTISTAATNEQLAQLNPKEVVVTAYAVQAAGFDTAAEAWAGANFS